MGDLAELLSVKAIPLIKECAAVVAEYQLEWFSSAVLSSSIQHMTVQFAAGRREELTDVINAWTDAFDHSFTVVRKEVENKDDCNLCLMLMKEVMAEHRACSGIFSAFLEAGILNPDITFTKFQASLKDQLGRSRIEMPPPPTDQEDRPKVLQKLKSRREKNPLIDDEPKKDKKFKTTTTHGKEDGKISKPAVRSQKPPPLPAHKVALPKKSKRKQEAFPTVYHAEENSSAPSEPTVTPETEELAHQDSSLSEKFYAEGSDYK